MDSLTSEDVYESTKIPTSSIYGVWCHFAYSHFAFLLVTATLDGVGSLVLKPFRPGNEARLLGTSYKLHPL